MKASLKFGIVGCGVISKWHANALAEIENAELVGAYDMNFERTKEFAKEFNCQPFETLEDMLSCDNIDAVCVCTISSTHAEIAVAAANHGKHVVVEKPMAITEEQLASVIEAKERNGVQLTVISQSRFSKDIVKVKEAIDNGELGKILVADVSMKFLRTREYYASAGWRGTWQFDGGGALMNQGIHGIDLIQYLVGPIKSVYGICRTLDRDIEVEDAAALSVEYESGAIGVIQSTTCVTPGYARRFEISGSRGTIAIEGSKIVRWDVDGKTLSAEEIVADDAKNFNDPTAFSHEDHARQLRNFTNAVLNGTELISSAEEGKRTVEVILGAYKSSKLGKKIDL